MDIVNKEICTRSKLKQEHNLNYESKVLLYMTSGLC